MPPRVPLNTRARAYALAEPYVCQSCFLKTVGASTSSRVTRRDKTNLSTTAQRRSSIRSSHPRRAHQSNARISGLVKSRHYASNGSLASTSAINAPTTVPQAYRDLHQKLLALQETASSYVDLARLQLVTKSLESTSTVVRVALLGLGSNGPVAARKLARVLLSDALGAEEAWEKEILDSIKDGRSLLLRYGNPEDKIQSNPLVKTMLVPSPHLERNNLEILVTGLNTTANPSMLQDEQAITDNILVPSLTTPNSAGGRVGFVRFPVHKAVVVAEGITGAVEYGRLPPHLADGILISAALSIPLRSSSGKKSAELESTGNAVDIDLADHALNLFRTNAANGVQFSEEWQTSHISSVGDWIAGPKHSTTSGMHPAVGNLVASVLSRTSLTVSEAEEAANADANDIAIPETKRTALQTAISHWCAEAHRDLQLNLDTAFSDSPSWRRTAWWRLFWRIDDVAVSASDVLRRSWLTEAEQSLAFLSGMIREAGLATPEQLRQSSPRLVDDARRAEMEHYEENKAHTETAAELLQMPSMLSHMQQQTGVNALFNPPWPQTINLSRQYMLHTLVPHLHRKAQGLLITTLSTIGGSTALAAWFYVASAGLGLYESGAILALGLVWSMRRLQKKWGMEREEFASSVREDARRVLGEVEKHLRTIVSEGGKVTVRPEDARSWDEARLALKQCQDALNSIDPK